MCLTLGIRNRFPFYHISFLGHYISQILVVRKRDLKSKPCYIKLTSLSDDVLDFKLNSCKISGNFMIIMYRYTAKYKITNFIGYVSIELWFFLNKHF